MSRHIIVSLSSHGFGHIGQTAPVIATLRELVPNLHITIRSSAPVFKLRERFGDDVTIMQGVTDIGMIQEDALNVSVEASATAYERFHDNWNEKVREEARQLSRLNPDLVFANIPYLSLAGAKMAGIPAIALCSLNWADIYQHYFEGTSERYREIHKQILDAYQHADRFLLPTPSMPMTDLNNTYNIGPVAQLGNNRREYIDATLQAGGKRLGLVSMGGIDFKAPVATWPDMPGILLLVPKEWHSRHPDTCPMEALDLPFSDLLRSVDFLITKPGYGSFVEAACTSTPVLYLQRNDWPEAPYLARWMEKNARCLSLKVDDITNGQLQSLVDRVSSRPAKCITPTGNQEAAEIIAAALSP
jgi:hypothetical protein